MKIFEKIICWIKGHGFISHGMPYSTMDGIFCNKKCWRCKNIIIEKII